MAAPIFIVGSGGSGSTLLRLILDSHEHIAIPKETCFMRLVKAHRWVPYSWFGDRWHRRLGLTDQDLDEALRDFYGGLFEQFARQQGKRRWGEKTPFHVWHMHDIARVFHDAVFVGIVRHPGGTTASMVGRFNFGVTTATTHWLDLNRAMVAHGTRMRRRFVLLRYEDLLLYPEETLAELLDWLGEPWSPAVLAHHDVQRQKGTPKVVDGRTVAHDPIDPGRISKWRETLSPRAQTLLRRRTGDWAAFFGYDVDEPLPVESLVAETSPRRRVVTGDELARRRKRFEGRLDFAPPPRPVHEGIFKPPPGGASRPSGVRYGGEPAAGGRKDGRPASHAHEPLPVVMLRRIPSRYRRHVPVGVRRGVLQAGRTVAAAFRR